MHAKRLSLCRWTEAVAVATLALLLAACGSQQSSPANYYVLAYSQTESSPRFEEPIFPADAVVLEPSVDPVFDRLQVVHRVSHTRLRYLSRELWAISPPKAFQRVVREAVTDIGAFPGVFYAGRDVDARYRIAVVVNAVELIQMGEEAPVAHLKMEMQLIDRDTVISQSSVLHREAMSPEADTPDFVDEVSRLVSRSVDQLFANVPEAERGDG